MIHGHLGLHETFKWSDGKAEQVENSSSAWLIISEELMLLSPHNSASKFPRNSLHIPLCLLLHFRYIEYQTRSVLIGCHNALLTAVSCLFDVGRCDKRMWQGYSVRPGWGCWGDRLVYDEWMANLVWSFIGSHFAVCIGRAGDINFLVCNWIYHVNVSEYISIKGHA